MLNPFFSCCSLLWVHAQPLAPPSGCCTRFCLQVGAAGQPCSVGDIVDCFINDGWWENSRVVALQKRGAQLSVKVVGEEKPVPVQLANSRPMLRFAGGQWSRVQAGATAAATPAAEAAAADRGNAGGADAAQSGKRQRGRQPGGSKKQQAAAAASAAAGEQQQDQPAAEAEQAAAEAEAEAAAEEQAEEPAHKKRRGRPGGSGKKQRAAAAAAAGGDAGAEEEPPSVAATAAAAAGAGAAGTPAGEPASGGMSPQPPTAAKSKRPATTGGSSAGAAGGKKAPPVYTVPADFDPSMLPAADLSSLRAARQSVPLAVCRRFLGLRLQVAEDQYPAYETTSTHLKGCDIELLAQALAEVMHT